MKATIIVESGNIDCHGNKLCIESIVIPEKELMVFKNFDYSNPIGTAILFKQNGNIMANIDIEDMIDGFPAISFISKKSHNNKFGGEDITDAKIISVGISSHPNLDSEIKTIKKQVNY